MRRAAKLVLPSILTASVFFACTFTRSLDYLTNGSDGGVTEGGSSGDGNSGPLPESGLPSNAETLASAQFNPRNLAQDAVNLYWTSNDAIMARPKAGGDVKTLASAGAGKIVSWLAPDVNEGGVLFVIVDAAVQKVDKAGGALTLVEQDAPPPIAVVASGANIFVAHADDNSLVGQVLRFALNGSQRAQLTGPEFNPRGLAVVGETLFAAGDDADGLGIVHSLPTSATADGDGGTTPTATIYKPAGSVDIYPDGPTMFAADEQALYWFDSAVDKPSVFRIGRASPSSNATPVFEAPDGTRIGHLVVDRDNVYLTDERPGGAVIKIPKAGGAPSPIAQNQPVPTGVVVDDKYVYFTLQGTALGPDGSVLRVPK